MRVLVVEDEQKVANALREGLEGEKYDVVVERTGEGAFFRVTTETFEQLRKPLAALSVSRVGALRSRPLVNAFSLFAAS